MDPITQGLLGATVSQACFTKPLQRDAWKIGFISGVLADADGLFAYFSSSNLAYIELHRQFSHALIFIPLGGLIAALLILISKRMRPQWKWVLAASIVGYATHAPLDMLTSYGTVILWPFSDMRVEWAVMSIVDPIFTLILAFGLFWSVITLRAKAARTTLIIALLYIGFGVAQHARAKSIQSFIAKQRGHHIVQSQVIPTIGNLILWRSIYESGGVFYADAIRLPLFFSAQLKRGYSAEKLTIPKLVSTFTLSAEKIHDIKIFQWFTNDYMAFVPNRHYVIGDMRLTVKPDSMVSIWGLKFYPKYKDKPVQWVRMRGDRLIFLKQIWREVMGKGQGFQNLR